ncbi:MAG: sugar transferase [Acidimicrobiales bacterium]
MTNLELEQIAAEAPVLRLVSADEAAGVIDLRDTLASQPVVNVRLMGWMPKAKSLLERSLAAVALLLLAVPFLVIAAIVRLTSPGPALFRQQRVGLNGRIFDVYKFRTMVDGADGLIDQIIDLNEHDGVLFKIKNDPRCTRFGTRLRRHSIDELPQLINVVRGDMSLVGPRPALPTEVAQYGATTCRRLQVKPGLTGLWQVSGRSNLSWDESVKLDLRYVEEWSPLLDVKILLRTVPAVLTRKGAY